MIQTNKPREVASDPGAQINSNFLRVNHPLILAFARRKGTEVIPVVGQIYDFQREKRLLRPERGTRSQVQTHGQDYCALVIKVSSV